MSDKISLTSSSYDRPNDAATMDQLLDDLASSGSVSGATAAASCGINGCGGTSRRRFGLRHGQPMHPCGCNMRWRRHWVNPAQGRKHPPINSSSAQSHSISSPGATSTSQSNNQQVLASSETYEQGGERQTTTPHSDDVVTPDSNIPVESKEESLVTAPGFRPASVSSESYVDVKVTESSSVDDGLFANLDSGSQTNTVSERKGLSGEINEVPALKTELANVIEKAILDFCSSRTVETMRRMFAGVTSEMEALQGEGTRPGDKTAQVPHPVTAELVKEGIVIGTMDVFAPRVQREYRLVMRDSLVAGFLSDTGVFRAICYRTKCQLEVTRRLLNRKLCTGGCWIKYLIIRITGPSLRAITCCDQLLQKAVPAFKQRKEYPKAAWCRLFFREDIPDNTLLYNGFQRTGGTSNRYGTLKLETPYRLTADRTVGTCPWKSGALKVGKLSFSGNGGHKCMQQVYPGYGYATTKPVEPASKGVEAIERIEALHNQFLTRRQQILMDRRVMTIPVCRG